MRAPPALEPEQLVLRAVQAARYGKEALARALDQIPVALYVTDAVGMVTQFNRACVALAGRRPRARLDRWCVTWKLYTDDGAYLPHEECPMAVAIREKRKVRGVTAVAERPDGTRVRFAPFPTPLLDDAQRLTGAVNLLVDLADAGYQQFLHTQAARCRRLSTGMDTRTSDCLLAMAAGYEQQIETTAKPSCHQAR